MENQAALGAFHALLEVLMRKFLVLIAALVAGIGGALVSGSSARADGTYTLDVCGGSSPIVSCGPYGTVTITGDGTGTLVYAFDLDGGAMIHGGVNGLTSVVMDVTGSIDTTKTAFSNNNGTTWAADASVNADGLGTFNTGF